jgi:hypothetical protein
MDLANLISAKLTDNTRKEFTFTNKQELIEFLSNEIEYWSEVENEGLENIPSTQLPRFFSSSRILSQAKNYAEHNSTNEIDQLNLEQLWLYSKHEFTSSYVALARKLEPDALKGYYFATANLNPESVNPQLILGMVLGYESLNSFTSITDRITKAKSEFSQLMNDSEKTRKEYERRFIQQEKRHNEFLTLKEPGKFWEDQAKTYQMQGWLWSLILGLVIALGLIFASNFYIAWLSGSDMKIGLNTLHGVVILGVIVTFFGFACIILSRLALSSFHLMRDAQERKLLTYLYLSLNKDDQLDQNSREIILQSLFSRSDSGLLSGDSSPTMPGGLNEIIRNLKNS